ncbi:hypothetical protein BY996DRAFT_7268992 [Phakopsora pachyrhizi]|nr:hypothetical protein BY996DRAFT_7268992 [Phakopsora pachyrhizi]
MHFIKPNQSFKHTLWSPFVNYNQLIYIYISFVLLIGFFFRRWLRIISINKFFFLKKIIVIIVYSFISFFL